MKLGEFIEKFELENFRIDHYELLKGADTAGPNSLRSAFSHYQPMQHNTQSSATYVETHLHPRWRFCDRS